MSTRRFLYCRACNAVHHVTPFDTAPVYELDGGHIRETPCDDRNQFISRHSGHRVGELISIAESRPPPSQILDPMKVTYIEVTDGREIFVLRSFRKSIADPLTYEVLPRQLMLWDFVHDMGSYNAVTVGVPVSIKNSPVRHGRHGDKGEAAFWQ